MNGAGLIVISALISPMNEDRTMAREIIGHERFVETYLSASIDVCSERDPKGLYAKARAGTIASFTDCSAPYEAPVNPDVHIDTATTTVTASVTHLFAHLLDHCLVT